MEKDGTRGLAIFPHVVWETLLDTEVFDDSKNIEAMFRAFPDLDIYFEPQKPALYFDQILPLFFKSLEPSDKKQLIRDAQAVCARWRRITKRFHHNHPSIRAYGHLNITRRSVPYGEFTYDDFPFNPVTDGFRFDSTAKLQQFLVSNHPRDPFQGEHVVLSNTESASAETFLDSALVFFQKFGPRVKSVSLNPKSDIVEYESDRDIFLKIVKCLSYLRTGRYLFVNFYLDLNDTITDTDLAENLPTTLKFETVHIGDSVSRRIRRILLNRFAPAKKLIIYRDFPLGSLHFGDLVELNISGVEDVSPIALCSNLKRLTLSCNMLSYTTKLFRLIESLKLDELELQCSVQWGDDNAGEVPQLPTVKYLRVTDYMHQNLTFLRVFTNLKHLEINWCLHMNQYGGNVEGLLDRYGLLSDDLTLLTNIVRLYMYRPVVPGAVSIWNELPSLTLLSVVSIGNPKFKVMFVKGHGNRPFYNYLDQTDLDED